MTKQAYSMRKDPKTSEMQGYQQDAALITENRALKRRVRELEKENSAINDRLDMLSSYHQSSVELSVDFLQDLEYHKYKAGFIEIDVEFPPGDPKRLKQYGQNIRRFFIDNLNCTYLRIQCGGIGSGRADYLNIKQTKRLSQLVEYEHNRTVVYYCDLQDIDMPERIIGRVVVGRYPYRDQKKESVFQRKIKEEIHLTKRLLENAILEIQNKELAVKDALTGLYTRKVFEERLSEEFLNLDLFSKLNQSEYQVLQAIMGSDGQPRSVIRGIFYKGAGTGDEQIFDSSVSKLYSLGMIAKNQARYLGDYEDFYSFIRSKIKYNLYIAIFDLDHFKDVNDNWGGHPVGDRILRAFADILKRNIRTTDMPIRYGGEEFILLFPRVAVPEKIVETVERIRKECERRLVVKKGDSARNVTVSIGLTKISKYDRTIEQIIHRADQALYRAKRLRNRLVFYDQERSDFVRVI